MPYAPDQSEPQIHSIEATTEMMPETMPDARARAAQEFIDAGQVRHITMADVIAYHDEINKLIA
jgi:hypothetical protein|tara:strand:- start:620 stop:811 length:192 start_codon:yes stop_codon:yes gene_type:complete